MAPSALRVASQASLSGLFDAVLRENSPRDQVTELRNKLGLDKAMPSEQVNHALNIFLLVQEIDDMQGGNPEDKSASSPSSSANEEIH